MFDHVELRTAHFDANGRALTAALGPGTPSPGLLEWDDFGYAAADEEKPPTEHAHIGLLADIEAFWREGLAAGLRDDGAPGPRPAYGDDYTGAFLLDHDGNSIEACRHSNSVDGSRVDHVWLRVSDLTASRAFYELVAPWTGFGLVVDEPGLARFRGPGASFTLVAGEPVTRRLHLAFPGDDAAVEAFYAAATGAGHPDNGAPGERPEYHPGYVAAFVLDPDGNNVEVVDHHR